MDYAGKAVLQNLHQVAPDGQESCLPSCPLMMAKPLPPTSCPG